MKKFFINNGNWLTMALTLVFFIMSDLTWDYLPKFSNIYLTFITYFIIVMIPVCLSIYYNNRKWKSITPFDKNYFLRLKWYLTLHTQTKKKN